MRITNAQKKEVARLLGNGQSIAKTAEAAGVSTGTVKRIKTKLRENAIAKPASVEALTRSYEQGVEEFAEEIRQKGQQLREQMWEQVQGAFAIVEQFERSCEWEKTTPKDLIAARESALSLAAKYLTFSDAVLTFSDEPTETSK